MSQNEDRAIEFLRELGSRPAVPFFEDGPAEFIFGTAAELGVDVRRERYGNIIARYGNRSAGHGPPVAFVAHMDHPGFEITKADEGRIIARALGGVPAASLTKPTAALVLMPDGRRLQAQICPPDDLPTEGQSSRLVRVQLLSDATLTPPLTPPLPVVFDLPDFILDGDTIRMRAADDLAGCASILAALERLVTEGAEADLYAVFTRAEEGGLLGARLIAEEGALPKETLVVSVEASSVIPGVSQGEGPVIRTGDAASTFSDEAEQLLVAARDGIRSRDPEFKCQRQLMSGGTCEATAFASFGYRTTGIAFPLGNYHNATTTIRDPDGGVDAEYIRLDDYLGGVEFIAEAARGVAQHETPASRRWIGPVPDDVRRRLESSAGR